MESHVQAVRDANARLSISQLPVEILTYVFVLIMNSFLSDDRRKLRLASYSHPARANLMRVSYSWWKAVLSAPRLWAVIPHIDPSTPVERVSTHLSLSKAVNIHLSLSNAGRGLFNPPTQKPVLEKTNSPFSQAIDIITPHITRCESLDIAMNVLDETIRLFPLQGDLRELRELSVALPTLHGVKNFALFDDEESGTTNVIQRLNLRCLAWVPPSTFDNINTSTLTEMHFTMPRCIPSTIYDFIAECPELQTLYLESSLITHRFITENTRITTPNLRKLEIKGHGGVLQLFQIWDAPKLCMLTLQVEGWSVNWDSKVFVFPELHTLTIRQIQQYPQRVSDAESHIQESDIIPNIIRNHASLIHLNIACANNQMDFLAPVLRQRTIVPMLQNFSITTPFRDVVERIPHILELRPQLHMTVFAKCTQAEEAPRDLVSRYPNRLMFIRSFDGKRLA